MNGPLVEAIGLEKHFHTGQRSVLGRPLETLHAVRGVSLSILRGETLGLVGESGCGKSTLGRLILRLLDPDAGVVRFGGREITGLSRSEMVPLRSRMQIVFQNPYATLNPRFSVRSTLLEVLAHRGVPPSGRSDRLERVLSLVGLPLDVLDRRPRQLSGGQLQRVGTARALLVEPEFLVADEPVSALDVSVQAQVLNMMADLRERLGLSILFIAHDLRVVEHVSDRVAVMYLGKIVEAASSEDLYSAGPLHPYSQGLLAAIPQVSGGPRRLEMIEGDPPSPVAIPRGCAFAGRCSRRMPRCVEEEPALREVGPGRTVACHLYAEAAR
jgi:oligopeptide/dipeptide ABC transporter ATP-binding protein